MGPQEEEPQGQRMIKINDLQVKQFWEGEPGVVTLIQKKKRTKNGKKEGKEEGVGSEGATWRIVKKFPRDLDIFSESTVTNPLWTQ